MNALLDLMDINGLSTEDDIVKYVNRAKTKDLLILMQGIIDAADLNEQRLNEHSPFSFIASPEVSGAGGCAERTCRLKRTDAFAVYSALYADKVYVNIEFINNPHFLQAFENQDKLLRYHFATDLLMINKLAPLIEKDIVRIVKPEFLFCKECASELLRDVGLDIDINQIEQHYMETVRVYLELDHEYNKLLLKFANVGDFFEHGILIRQLRNIDPILFNKLKNSPNSRYELTKEEIQNYGFFRQVLEHEVNRLRIHALEARIFNTKFLTSKNFDSLIFESSSNKVAYNTDYYLDIKKKMPVYNLPIIYGTSLDNILKIREEERGAFDKYRIALSKAAKERMKSYSIRELNDIYEDIIYPSFTELDYSLKKLHRSSIKKAIGEIFITASVVSLGVYSGFVPPDPKSILTTLGGVGALTKAGSSVIDWSRKKDEIKDNDYYFLWKLKNEE